MNINIPQVEVTNLNIELAVNPPEVFEVNAASGDDSEQDIAGLEQKYFLFDDGSFLSVNSGYILLGALEKNVLFERENFDIELYLVEEENGVESLHPLKFIPPTSYIDENGILVDRQSVNMFVKEYKDLGVDYSEYFFDVQADGDIDQDLLASFLTTSKKENIFADLKIETQTLTDSD